MKEPKSISTLVAEAVHAMQCGIRPYPDPDDRRPVPYDPRIFPIDRDEDSGLDDYISPHDDEGEYVIINVYRRVHILTPEGHVTKVYLTRGIAIKNIPKNQKEIAEWREKERTHKEELKVTLQNELKEEQLSDEEKMRLMRSRKARILRDPCAWKGRCTVKKGRQTSNGREKIRKTSN